MWFARQINHSAQGGTLVDLAALVRTLNDFGCSTLQAAESLRRFAALLDHPGVKAAKRREDAKRARKRSPAYLTKGGVR
jgi:hypothetical protein